MNELTKTKTFKMVDKVCLSINDQSPEEITRQLTTIIKNCRKTNITQLTIGIESYEGDSFTLPSDYITINGLIEETDQEWHNRLQHQKRQNERKLEEATQTIHNMARINDDIDAINKALSNSPLRCVDCNKPQSSQTCSQDTGRKTIRICNNCLAIRKTKREQKQAKIEAKRRKETR